MNTDGAGMNGASRLITYVDIDDTLVRSFRQKRVPMTEMIKHVRDLFNAGVTLYAWSSGGGEYARATSVELGLEDCFQGFLPKPNVIIDDQSVAEWRRLIQIHPTTASTKTADDYAVALNF